jgi:hypothetical protein
MAQYHARALRASRASPPGLAADDEGRQLTYNAALQQFEELLDAARAVGPASRPLPLFYALSQAGRAVVAANGERPNINSHGLVEERTIQPDDLLHRRIERAPRKDGTDAFGAVARATGSADLQCGADLGALWAATPGVYRVPTGSWQTEWRLAIDVENQFWMASEGGFDVMLSHLAGNPEHSGLEVFRGGRYPTIPIGVTGSLRGGTEIEPGSWIADSVFPGSVADQALDPVAPKVYGTDSRALIPTLPGESDVLSPLMLWWALLFGLSIVARYHPGPWARALAVEGSSQAVPLEALLEKAIEVLPPLVYEAIFSKSPTRLG